jgi:hypothetical protein
MAKKDDEAEMKQRGLDISNRAREEGTEKTGFFQRLREGNIDDPNSAAYKKYGAGRARLDDQIETGKLKLADDVKKKVKDDADFAEADRMSSTARSVAGKPASNAAPSAKAKSGIVTKEQLAKSGFDNLRDYMNAEKGLKRRDGAAATTAKEKSAAEKRSATRTADVAAKKPQAERRSDTRLRASNASANAAGAARAIRYNSIEDNMYNPGSKEAAYAERGMKAGGSVRGAGIAKQGVRKCKMV